MTDIRADKELVAYCGLYCGACGKHRQGRCLGCHENSKASWCKVRTCCREHGYATCAECREFVDIGQCAKFNNIFSKVIGLLFNSNRQACVAKIRTLGIEEYARFMAERGLQSLPRRGLIPGGS